MKLALYWRYAVRSLMRGGQRTLLAIFCIAVGVMAIVALQLVGNSINSALTGNVRDANGGDVRVSAGFLPFEQKDLTSFDNLKSDGQISDYAMVNSLDGVVTQDNGDNTTFSVLSVSANYPLISQPDFTAPSSDVRIQDIAKGNKVVISSGVADGLHAHVNDRVQIKLADGRLIDVVVGAIYKQGGAYNTKQMIVSQSWLNAIPLPNGKTTTIQYSTIDIATSHADQVKKTISDAYPTSTVTTVADELKQQQDSVNNIRIFLQVVGLIALFIGGIGIINTMQVLLRRRQVEIAMLKTSGYRQGDLFAMFGLEAGLLGFVGGIVGSALGVAVSGAVRTIINRSFSIDLPISYDGATIASGLYIGFATALIFGLLPIVESSQIRPIAVLRGLTEEGRGGSRILTAVLLVLLSVLFVGLAATIIGDVAKAAVIVYGGVLLVSAVAVGFSLLVLAISHLPVYERPSFRILIWLLIALGAIIGSLIATGLLFVIGGVVAAVAGALGQGGIGFYITAAFVILGLVLIGGSAVFFLAALVDAIVMFLPRAWKTTVMLAYRNIGRQQIRTTTTLTILFVSVFAIGIVVIMGQGVKDAINNAIASFITRNVFILAPPNQSDAVSTTLNAPNNGVDSKQTITATVSNTGSFTVTSINGQDFRTVVGSDPLKGYRDQKNVGQMGIVVLTNSFQGFNLASTNKDELPPTGNDKLGQPVMKDGTSLTQADIGTNNVVVGSTLELPPLSLKVGDTITVAQPDGSDAKTLMIKGFYNDSGTSVTFGTMWADVQLVKTITNGNVSIVYQVKMDPNHVTDLRKSLKTAAPNSILISLADVSSVVDNVLNKLIVMLTSIASLVMISGLVIIANAVTLAMLERRREIGILKTVGHSTGSVLATIMLENGLVGLLGALVAMVLVGGAITVLNKVAFDNLITLSVPLGIAIIGGTAILTVGISALVAYSAARVRPLQVLRYE
jgi:putative ABC transport system permease protein